MPVQVTRELAVGVAVAGAPGAPTNVTSITKDSGASVSFIAPADQGSSSITHYIVTPYVGATPQSPTTVAVGSLGTITGAYNGDSQVYRRAEITGLTNSTAYTFTVKARNSNGDSVESTASGANTPLAGLVFGDDFNGPAGGQIDPEWWVYDRNGFLAQNEVQYYKPQYCVLDGSGNLKITAEHVTTSGPRYWSDPAYPGTINQPWGAGACQSNTRTWYPSAGNTMTYEARFQINPNAGNGFWPGFFWLNGQFALDNWKTDPASNVVKGGGNAWNSTDHAEIDIAEWNDSGQPSNYGNVTWADNVPDSYVHDYTTDFSQAMHTYAVQWKPGVRTRFLRDGSETHLCSDSNVPASGAQFVLLLYLQMSSGGPTGTESIYTDYVRVYDQNLG